MPSVPASYRGRFAPSPTGSLHFGSLVAALGSYLDARRHRGQWLIRIEDLDPPREVPGAADDILHTLEAYGFQWDGKVQYQSQRLTHYQEAMEELLSAEKAFPCTCTRSDIATSSRMGSGGWVYPGTCRNGVGTGSPPRSIRIRTHADPISFRDRIQGRYSQSLQQDIGDYVIRRADGLFAYQLAVVVDDAWQGVSHVVRGLDLLTSTPRQIHLQGLLDIPTPVYAHLPLVVDAAGRKLSKQWGSRPVTRNNALESLTAAHVFLNQEPPVEKPATLEDFWDWALSHWEVRRIPALETDPPMPGPHA
jgi:glutamyl-Q tRNA(Asp) synthetase